MASPARSQSASQPEVAAPATEPAEAPTEDTAAGQLAEGFSAPQTAQLVGITYRQLDHWARKGLVRPSKADASGSGSRRRYSYNDLLELKIAKSMREVGIDLAKIADAFDYLRDQIGVEVASANIVISGKDVLHVDDDEVLSLLRQGQGAMLTVLPLAGVRRELEADVVKLFPEEPLATQLSLEI